jgi:spore coat protein CotF
MNDKLLMTNYLMILKSTIEVYVHGTIESSNEDVRKILKLGLDETLLHQSRVFDEMNSYDFYDINNINPEIISQTLEKISMEN